MTNQPFPKDEHKFDTLSLLAGLREEDIQGFSLDEILNEYTGRKENLVAEPKTVLQNPAQSPVKDEPATVFQPQEEDLFLGKTAKKQNKRSEKKAAKKSAKAEAVQDVSVRSAHSQEQPVAEAAAAVMPDFLFGDLEEVGAVPAQELELPESLNRMPEELPAQDASADNQAMPEAEPAAEEQPEEPSLIDQIQYAIDRDLELNQATPEPVFHVAEDGVPTLGDPDLDAIFKDKLVHSTEELPVDPDAEEKPVEDQTDSEPAAPAVKLQVVAPLEPVPAAADLYKRSVKHIRPFRMRMTAVLALTLFAVIITAINQFGWSEAAIFTSNKVTSKILLAIMFFCAALSVDVIKAGVKSIFSLRVNGASMMTLIFLVTAIDAILCGDDNAIPFCAVVCVQFYFAVWGAMLQKLSIRRSLKPILKQEKKFRAVSVVEDAWEGGNLASSVEDGSEEEHVRGLLKANLAEKRMMIYAPVAIALTLVLAFLVRFKTGNSLTWSWSSMMIGALPVAGFICYYRPFAILSARLMKQGAAVSGWAGAERLANAGGIALQDHDVFPEGSVKINGMKVYGSFSVGQTVGYAAAVIEASGSGLTPLFQELRSTNNGRFFTVTQFRRYEGGGYGAEIAGDVVLLGSLRFMQLMGVYMDEGTKVRNAIYLSVNGEMCAVFALSYGASGKIRKGLRQIVGAAGIIPVFATRDFLITPLMVEERYKVANANLEFPSAEERYRLSKLPGDYPASQGAVLVKSGLGAYADAVLGGRLLRMVTSMCSLINLVGGFVGIVLMFLLTWLGAVSAVTAMNMLLFALVWALPTIILTSWLARY